MKIDFNKYINKKSFIKAINFDDSQEIKIKKENPEDLINEILNGLQELALNGFLKPIEFSDIHSTNFSYAWNKFINQEITKENDPEFLMRDIKRFIEKIVFYNTVNNKNDNETKQFNDFINFLNKGNFSSYCTPSESCFNCGNTMNLEFENWVGKYYEYKEILDPTKYLNKVSENSPASFLNKMDYFPADNCFNEFTTIRDFEFKTGNLIITDWIRIKELNDLIHPNGDIYHFNTNAAKGRNDLFEHLFNQKILSMSSFSGLTMYSLKEKDYNDCLFFGKIDYSKKEELNKSEYKYEKEVNPGLRATTIIEEETLIELINRKYNDINKSKEIVKKYLDKNKHEIIKRKINPGLYTIIYNNKDNDLSDLLFPKNIDSAFNSKIYLYPKNLTPQINNKLKI